MRENPMNNSLKKNNNVGCIKSVIRVTRIVYKYFEYFYKAMNLNE